MVTDRVGAAAGRRAARSTRSGCPTTGARAGSSRATRPTTCSPSRSIPTSTSASTRRRPATSGRAPAAAGRALLDARRRLPPAGAAGGGAHDATASASSPTRRCASAARRARSPAGVERRPRRTALELHRRRPTTTRGALGAQHLAPRRVRRAGPPTASGMRWLMISDVCKHCTSAACLEVCPTGALVPHRVRHRRRAAGRLQRLRLLRARLPVRRDRPARGRRAGPQVHPLLRPPEGRHGAGAARRRAPTESIQFGAARRSCASGAVERLEVLHAAGESTRAAVRRGRRRRRRRRARSSCSSTSPRSTACRPIPVVDDARPRLDVARAAGARRGAAGRDRGRERSVGGDERLLLRAADPQGAGVDVGDRRPTSSSAAWRARPRRFALVGRAARRRARSRAARGSVALAGVGGEPAAADLRPRSPRALPPHAARVQADLADEHRLVDPRRAPAPRSAWRARAACFGWFPRLGRAAGATAVLGPALATYYRRARGRHRRSRRGTRARRELPFGLRRPARR